MAEKTLLHDTAALLGDLGIAADVLTNGDFPVASPIDGSRIATIHRNSREDLDGMIALAERAFLAWREIPPPRRGELVRLFAEQLRQHKAALGRLVSIEAGKILEEGQGEVQEMIDICDFAVGLSRQLYGKVIASERPGHRMLESWHPLGPVAIITAFNFPVAVWSWNAALALVCGDPLIWKPSDKTPLCALACNALLGQAIERFGEMPEELRRGLSQVAIGGAELGEALAEDRRVPVVSATGSTRMGGHVFGAERVLAERWPEAYYVRPALVEMAEQTALVRRETFAPILYVMRYRDLEEAIATHNAVPQGLASSIFTTDLREAELFTSAAGSDCGIVNVNIGPSGAEIGGAFGGEKETGGGREAGSDSWKAYMRRMTTTINYSRELPLAQGIRFAVDAP